MDRAPVTATWFYVLRSGLAEDSVSTFFIMRFADWTTDFESLDRRNRQLNERTNCKVLGNQMPGRLRCFGFNGESFYEVLCFRQIAFCCRKGKYSSLTVYRLRQWP